MSELTLALFPRDYEPIEPAERWRPVVGREGEYEVSDLGRVRSLDRVIIVPNRWGGTHQMRLRGKVLAPGANAYGHLHVNLGRDETHTIHTLVAAAFLGQRPAGMEVCHGPGGKTDNRAVNLSYGTREKNQGPDRRRDGTDANGDRHGNAKLTWEQVDEIRRRHFAVAPPPGVRRGPSRWATTGETQQQLADAFGVSRRAIREIVHGEAWRPEFRHHAS